MATRVLDSERTREPKRPAHKGLAIMVLMLLAVALTYTTPLVAGTPQQLGAGPAMGLTLKWSYATMAGIYASPVVADLDKDGQPEVLVGSYDAYVYCLNKTGGQKWVSWVVGAVLTLTVADVDGDGQPEVIVGTSVGYLECLSYTGAMKWTAITGGAVCASSDIVDLDGDGQVEVLAGSRDHGIYCFNGTGGVKWEFATGAEVVAAPIVFDLTGDGQLEVAVGSRDCNLYCLNRTGGMLFRFKAGDHICSAPAAADVDGDGKTEVLFGTARAEVDNQSVYCLNWTGGLMWTYLTNGGVFSSPTVADVDGDGQLEVLVGAWSPNGGIFCLSKVGSLKWRYAGADSASPVVTDLDGDMQVEILAPTGIVCLNGAGILKSENTAVGFAYNAPVVADLDGDGRLEVVVGSWDHSVYCLGVTSGPTPPIQSSVIALVAIGIVAGSMLLAVAFLRKRGRGDYGNEGETSETRNEENANESSSYAIVGQVDSLASSICPNCGASVVSSVASFCSNCGSRLPSRKALLASARTCTVCHLKLKSNDELASCPHCGAPAHKSHLLEWVHVKGHCPVCKVRLNEEELR